MNSLRKLVESIAYVGMKPDAPVQQRDGMRWLGPFRAPIERFLNGPGSDDPLFLTNRTAGQKMRLAFLIAIPSVLVLGGVALAAMGIFQTAAQRAGWSKPLDSAEVARRMLPDLKRDIQLETNHDIQVLDVVVGGGKISGSVRNMTSKVLTEASVDFDLTDGNGSLVGGISCRMPRLEPNSSAPFHLDIPQASAVYALVRSVHTQ